MTYKILVPIDTIDEHITELATMVNNLCLHADSCIQLLHVLPDLEDIDAKEVEEKLQNANDLLADFTALLKCPAEGIEHHIQMGKPESEIMKRAIIGGADVIVMPTRAKTGINRFLLGSVTEHIMRHVHCPVVTTRKHVDHQQRDKSIAKILVPLDGSLESALIIPTVVDFANTHQAEIILFHDEQGTKEDDVPEADAGVDARLEAIMQSISAQGINVRLEKSMHCDPVKEIIQKVEEFDTDMVAMTTHGRTGLARFVFGSVAEKFMQKSQCPLLTVSIAPTHSTEYVEKYLG
jgi:nucleotide-binding universal stress UspA family protein